MTKKDYILLANRFSLGYFKCKVLADYHKEVDEPNSAFAYRKASDEIYNIISQVAFDLAKDNPRFNRDKFMEAATQDRPHDEVTVKM